MQYILSEDEYQEFCRLRSEAAKRDSDSDAEKTAAYLAGLATLKLADWQQVSGRLPQDVVADIDKLHERSEQRLLRQWQLKEPDFFNRRLCWALKAELAAEESKMVWPQGALPNSFFAPHVFQGSQDRDCKICKMPDRNPVHRVEPAAASTETR